MNADASIPVLRQLGVFDRVRPNMVPGSNFVFCDQNGNRLLELPSSTDDKHLNLRFERSLLKAGQPPGLTPLHPSGTVAMRDERRCVS